MGDSIDKKLSEALNIPFDDETTDIVVPEETAIAATENSQTLKEEMKKDLEKDYRTVRKNLRSLMKTGSDALETLVDFAKDSEQARPYEVLAIMIKNLSEVNANLIDLHQRMNNVQISIPGGPATQNVTNNTLFVGSTKDLQNFMKMQKQQILEDILIEKEDHEDMKQKYIDAEFTPVSDEDEEEDYED